MAVCLFSIVCVCVCVCVSSSEMWVYSLPACVSLSSCSECVYASVVNHICPSRVSGLDARERLPSVGGSSHECVFMSVLSLLGLFASVKSSGGYLAHAGGGSKISCPSPPFVSFGSAVSR